MRDSAQTSLLDLFEQVISIENEKRCGDCLEPLRENPKKRGRLKTYCVPCAALRMKNRKRYPPSDFAKSQLRKRLDLRIIPKGKCRICDIQLVGRRTKYCSTECGIKYHALQDIQEVKDRFGGEYPTMKCHECEAEFIGRPLGPRPRKFCSQVCSKKSISRLRCKARRAATKTEIWDYVDPLIIFRRDNWTCQLCGCETPAFKRGLVDDDAPSLDHKIPLSRGGAHTEENCRCLCRLCNGLKGDRLDDELEPKQQVKKRR